uniref:Coatomer subunit beta' n=1 Tax=Globodera rostochiensis TaxID=31243 RepID=A0A914HZL6_GLORO
MPLRLDVKRKLLARSDRVKSVDLHQHESWMLISLYNGFVHMWNYDTQQLIKSFEVCELPVRAAKFVVRKNWIATGSDDMQLRIFNYNTLERVHQMEAHSDYLRSIAVHPTQPFLLTSSDDMLIKLWDWEDKWKLKQTFEGHTHYVMQLVINPKDNNTFATASLDKTIKVWQFGSSMPNFTLEGHEKGVNCVDYYHGGEKPYLISGADDRLIKIWDYQNKTCVVTLDGHSHNVSAVCFHPELPIIITGSEDSTVRIWHANTNRLETTLNYGLERVWCIIAQRGSNTVAIGYDEGSVTINLGREEPAVSMDASGKVLWARHTEIQLANLKTIDEQTLDSLQDGERLALAIKEMGSTEIYPQKVQHSPNGRFVVVCGDGEYIIYTATALRNKSFGSSLDFAWANDSNLYAVQESSQLVKVFKNFKEVLQIRPDIMLEGINGGHLLAARSAGSLLFYDWDTGHVIRRVEIAAKNVYWSENGEMVAIGGDQSLYILKYNADAVANANVADIGPDGIEDAFEVIGELSESVKTGFWIGYCFIFTTTLNRLSYYVGGELVTIAHMDRPLYLLGYLAKENRVFASDKDHNIVSYKLLLSVLEYQTAVMCRDFDTADRILKAIPESQYTRVAQFLEKQGFKKQALAAQQADSEEKWKQLAHAATIKSELRLAGECLAKANDFGGLLLLASCAGSNRLMAQLATESHSQGQHNVSFLSNFLLGNVQQCIDTLVENGRIPEAAFFAHTYAPSQVSHLVALWRDAASQNLSGISKRNIGESLADPLKYENLFPGFAEALQAEKQRDVGAEDVQTVGSSSKTIASEAPNLMVEKPPTLPENREETSLLPPTSEGSEGDDETHRKDQDFTSAISSMSSLDKLVDADDDSDLVVQHLPDHQQTQPDQQQQQCPSSVKGPPGETLAGENSGEEEEENSTRKGFFDNFADQTLVEREQAEVLPPFLEI